MNHLPLDAYVRVSRVGGRNGDSFISPQVQEDRCRAMAKARGHEIGEVIVDLDASGGTMDRPGLNRALERIGRGESGGIIVARIDRFSRTLRGALDTLERIERSGGVLIECDGNWDTSSPMGRFGRDLVLRIGQLYREQVSEQWDDAKRKAVERGVHPTVAPIGYARDPDTRRLVPDPTTAEAVQELFRLRGSGASWRELIDSLDARGIAPARGETWAITTVSQIVKNPAYLGQARMSGHVNTEAHEPLVTRGEWLAAQVKHPGRVARGTDGARLSGIVFCASCGGRLTASLPELDKRDGRTGPGRYVCRRLNSGRNGRCTAPTNARMDHLDALVVSSFVERYTEEIGQLDDAAAPIETKELSRNLRAATEARDTLLEDVASLASLRSEDRAKLLKNAQDAVDEAQSALDAVEVAHTTSVLNVWDASDLFEPEGFKELSIPEQRRLLTLGISRVVVQRGKEPLDSRVTIEWSEP